MQTSMTSVPFESAYVDCFIPINLNIIFILIEDKIWVKLKRKQILYGFSI